MSSRNDRRVKQERVVAFESIRNSSIIHKEKTQEINVLWVSLYLNYCKYNYSKIIKITIIIIIIIASYYLYCANWHKNMIKCALHKWGIKINNVTPTQSYENRVSKHFVIFLNFPCLIACLLYCLLLLLDCLVVRDLCRILPPLPSSLPPYFFSCTLNSLIKTSDSYLKSVRA